MLLPGMILSRMGWERNFWMISTVQSEELVLSPYQLPTWAMVCGAVFCQDFHMESFTVLIQKQLLSLL